jgi:hypothetical protein
MSFHIISKCLGFKEDDNCVLPLGQTARHLLRYSHLTPGMEWLSNPLTWRGDWKFPFPEERYFWLEICKPRQCRVLLCNGSIQFNYLFPKPDAAFLNWNWSRLDLLAPLESQHNKFYCFISTAVQFIAPQVLNITHCFRSALSTPVFPKVETHCYVPQTADTTPGSHSIGDWVGPRAGLDGCGKSRPHRDSIPGPSSP